MTQLSVEQLAMRATGVGSSEIAAIVGMDPFKSPLDVWLDKMGLAVDETNINMRMGNRMEEAIAEEYAEQRGVQLQKCGTIVHPEYPWIFATPDRRVVGEKRLVECKNVGYRIMRAWDEGADGAPAKVVVQVTWQMMVTGDDDCDIAAWLGGRDFMVYPVAFDPGFARSLRTIADSFWRDYVLTGAEPPPDERDTTREYLEKKHPTVLQQLLEPTIEADAIAETYRRARANEKAAKATKDKAANELRAIIGDAEGIRGICSWKQSPKTGKRTLRVFGTDEE